MCIFPKWKYTKLNIFMLFVVHFPYENNSELNVDNWNDNCEAKNEAKRPRPLRGLQVDFSLTRNVSYAVR